jgi:hypothetical protein
MVSTTDEGEDKVFTAVEVQALLDKQRNKLNERFAALEARFSALDAKSAHPEVVEVAPKESPNSEKAKVDIPPKPDGPSSHAKLKGHLSLSTFLIYNDMTMLCVN